VVLEAGLVYLNVDCGFSNTVTRRVIVRISSNVANINESLQAVTSSLSQQITRQWSQCEDAIYTAGLSPLYKWLPLL
jgi:hypothetical protein